MKHVVSGCRQGRRYGPANQLGFKTSAEVRTWILHEIKAGMCFCAAGGACWYQYASPSRIWYGEYLDTELDLNSCTHDNAV